MQIDIAMSQPGFSTVPCSCGYHLRVPHGLSVRLHCPRCQKEWAWEPPTVKSQVPTLAPQPAEDEVSQELLAFARRFGLDKIGRVLGTVHVPIRGIRRLLQEPQMFSQVVSTYVQFLTFVPVVNKELFSRLSRAVDYPLLTQVPGLENHILLYLISAACQFVILGAIFLLPQSLFSSTTRARVFAVNLQLGMYSAVYACLGDLSKFLLWALFHVIVQPVYVKWAVIGITALIALYVWRSLLSLRWPAIILLIGIGIAYFNTTGVIREKMALTTGSPVTVAPPTVSPLSE